MTQQEDEDVVEFALRQLTMAVGTQPVATTFHIMDAIPDPPFSDFSKHGMGGRGGGSKHGLVCSQRTQNALGRLIGKGKVIKVGIMPAPATIKVKGKDVEPSASWVAVYRLA